MILKEGFRAPDFRIASVGGVSKALHDYAGKPTLLYGWGSWHPSREALADLQGFHEKHPDVNVLSVSFDAQGPGFAMKYLKPAGASYECLIDATCTISRHWGVKDLPVCVLLDAEGYVKWIGENFDAAAVAARLTKDTKHEGELKIEKPKGHAKLEILVQGCPVFLSRGRTEDAANSLKEALKVDPDNKIVEGQIAAVLEPEKVYGKS